MLAPVCTLLRSLRSKVRSSTLNLNGYYYKVTNLPTGLSEALAGELSVFGIRVLIVEPGGMRTSFVNPKTIQKPFIPEAYKGTAADFVLTAILQMHGKQNLDPKRSAEAIVKEVINPCSNPPLLRLPLGRESHEGMKKTAEKLAINADACEKIALGADF